MFLKAVLICDSTKSDRRENVRPSATRVGTKQVAVLESEPQLIRVSCVDRGDLVLRLLAEHPHSIVKGNRPPLSVIAGHHRMMLRTTATWASCPECTDVLAGITGTVGRRVGS